MKLVTFLNGNDQERAGILIEDDQKILDLRSSNEMNGRSLRRPKKVSVAAGFILAIWAKLTLKAISHSKTVPKTLLFQAALTSIPVRSKRSYYNMTAY